MKSKNLIIIALGIIVLAIGLFLIIGKKQTTETSTIETSTKIYPNVIVKMQDNTFVPEKITVKKNQTVVFVNESKDNRWPASNVHPTHQIYPQFDPKKPVPPKSSWSFKFDKVGIWKFHDHLFPNLTGTVTVEE